MRIAAVLAAVLIGTSAMPAVTAFAQGNDPEQTAAVETTAEETTAADVAETLADAATAESGENDTEAKTDKADETEAGVDLSGIDVSKIPGLDLEAYTDILSGLDPEVVEVLLKKPKAAWTSPSDPACDGHRYFCDGCG